MVQDLHRNVVLPYSLPKASRRLLLTGWGAKKQTEHNEFVVRGEGSPGYFSIFTDGVSVHLNTTSGLHLCVLYTAARNRLLRKALMMKEAKPPRPPVFVSHGYVQHADSDGGVESYIRFHNYFNAESHDLPDAVPLLMETALLRV